MDENFNIYIDRLKKGHDEQLDLLLPPDFMDIHEADLNFIKPVHIKGFASLTDETLIIQLTVETEAQIPCSICNSQVSFKIFIPQVYITEDIENIRGHIFNYQEPLREQILLELPPVVECNNGSCPERTNVAQFLKKNGDESNHAFHPFKDL